MELIKLSDRKTKLRLDATELEHYGLCRENTKNVKAIERLLTELKNRSGIMLISRSARVKILFLEDGDCEIILEKLEGELKIHTFIFNKAGLDRALSALKRSDAYKNSALYEYKNGIYIWELLGRDDSPLPCRLSDFGREVELISRRDFLTVLCRRLPFPEKNFLS